MISISTIIATLSLLASLSQSPDLSREQKKELEVVTESLEKYIIENMKKEKKIINNNTRKRNSGSRKIDRGAGATPASASA